MKRTHRIGWITLFLIIIPILLCAQTRPNRGMNNCENGTQYARMFNPGTIQTTNVIVEKVETFTPQKGMTVGTRLIANTNDKIVVIHLGPVWFINNQEIQVEKGDTLEIVGSLIEYEGEEVIVAKTVQHGEDILTLRNDFGRPVWAGWMRGQGKGRIN